MKPKDDLYYHAGVRYPGGGEDWSPHTRRTFEAAAQEARRMAQKSGILGAVPIVEWWSRAHGLRPRAGADAVSGAEEV